MSVVETKSIERLFLNSLLKVSIFGILFILLTDVVVFPDDRLSIIIDVVILASALAAFFIRKAHPNVSVLIFCSVILMAMLLQCLLVPVNTTTSLSVILILGFIFSVMLRGSVMWVMHVLVIVSLQVIFYVQFSIPEFQFGESIGEVITIDITYLILYTMMAYATGMLKGRYDKMNESLKKANSELHNKATELEVQHGELIEAHSNLNALNTSLEKLVSDRTEKVQAQNEMLIKYSYTNAHDLRGPVARLLGLAELTKVNSGLDLNFIVNKMVDQANEIDVVIRRISADLASNKISH